MSQIQRFEIWFRNSGRGKAQCPPDPAYPDGKALDVSLGEPERCTVTLPYPAPECGAFLIHCRECRLQIAITAAGRPDDPTEVTVPCRKG